METIIKEFKVHFITLPPIVAENQEGRTGKLIISDDKLIIITIEQRSFSLGCHQKNYDISISSITDVDNEEELLQFTIPGLIKNYIVLLKLDSREDVQYIVEQLPTVQSEKFAKIPEKYLQEQQKEHSYQSRLSELTPRIFSSDIIIALNVFLFLAMFASSGWNTSLLSLSLRESSASFPMEPLLQFGADYGPLTLGQYQWWRLITSTFVHIGLLHLLANMGCLWQVGRLLERLYGHTIFILIYLGSALFGSIFSIYMLPMIVSAGASGAIFGLYGSLTAYFLFRRKEIPLYTLKTILPGTAGFLLANLLIGFFTPFINNYAHLGGLVAGFMLGILGSLPLDEQKRVQQRPMKITLVLGGIALALCLTLPILFQQAAFWSWFSDVETEDQLLSESFQNLATRTAQKQITNQTLLDESRSIQENYQRLFQQGEQLGALVYQRIPGREKLFQAIMHYLKLRVEAIEYWRATANHDEWFAAVLHAEKIFDEELLKGQRGENFLPTAWRLYQEADKLEQNVPWNILERNTKLYVAIQALKQYLQLRQQLANLIINYDEQDEQQSSTAIEIVRKIQEQQPEVLRQVNNIVSSSSEFIQKQKQQLQDATSEIHKSISNLNGSLNGKNKK